MTYRTYSQSQDGTLSTFDKLPDCDTYHEALRGLINLTDAHDFELEPKSSQSWQTINQVGEPGAVVVIRKLPTFGRVTEATLVKAYA